MEYVYQVEALKDDLEELEATNKILQKELKSRTRQHETLKRDHKQLELDLASQKLQFEERFKAQDEESNKLILNIQQLEEELERHKKSLEESEKARIELLNKQTPAEDNVASTRETNKQTREYHYKWKMAEQENAVLQTACNRLENQVARYKESLKEAETVEGELKAEKRKLLRELRESQAKVEELETNNTHLQKRLDRLRTRNLLAGAETTIPTTASPLVPASGITPNSSLNSIPNPMNNATK